MDNTGRFLASISALLVVAYLAGLVLPWGYVLALVFGLPGYVIGFMDGVKYEKTPPSERKG